jgi:outer membrane protein
MRTIVFAAVVAVVLGPPAVAAAQANRCNHGCLPQLRDAHGCCPAAAPAASTKKAKKPKKPAVRVGYVDVERIVAESVDGRAAKARLKQEHTEKQRELDAAQTGLKQQTELLDRDKDRIGKDAYDARKRLLERQMVDLQQKYVKYQQELQQHENDAMRPLWEEISARVSDVAKLRDVSFVLAKSDQVLWIDPDVEIDLTDEVIKRMDAD